MRKAASRQLTKKQRAELANLAALGEADVDTGAIPEVRDWTGAKRGLFYKPIKRQLTLRLDADVVEWFKRQSEGGGYQTRINRALRDHVRRQRRKAG